MRPADMKLGVLMPIWTGSLDDRTPTMREAIAFAQHAETVGSVRCV